MEFSLTHKEDDKMSDNGKSEFSSFCGCLVALILLPVVCFVGYALFHIILWLIPLFIVIGIVIGILYVFYRGIISIGKD